MIETELVPVPSDHNSIQLLQKKTWSSLQGYPKECATFFRWKPVLCNDHGKKERRNDNALFCFSAGYTW